jgi:hypothetical protein
MKRSMFVLVMSLVTVFGLFSSSLSASTLVAAWTFDDGTASDVSGVLPALNGTFYNGAAIITDPCAARNKILSCNPSGTGFGAVLLGYDQKLYFGRSMTIQYWVKKRNPGESWKYVVGAGGWLTRVFSSNRGFYFGLASSYFDNWGPLDASQPGNFLDPQIWHHMVVTYDGINLYGYIDGVQTGTLYRNGTIMGGDNYSNYWAIGRQWNGGSSGGWESSGGITDLIDDVAIWNGYAPPEVVMGLYNGTYTIFNAPMVEPDVAPLNFAAGDFDRTGLVNFVDYSRISDKWLEDCTIVNCNGVNLYPDSDTIDSNDFSLFADDWLYNTGAGKSATIENLMGVPTFKVDSNFTTAGTFSHCNPDPGKTPIAAFAQIGTIIQDFSGYSTKGWLKVDPNKGDYCDADRRISWVLQNDPNVLLMPWIDVVSPGWWVNDSSNQNELEMVDSGSGATYTHSNGSKYASIASDKWRQDMAYALEKYLEYCYRWGYMKNIVGFKFGDIGVGGENLWRTAHSSYLGGYGVRTKEAFRNWLRVHYNNDVSALRAAWNNSTVTFETATTPTRSQRTASSSATFRTETTSNVGLSVVDFDLFWNDLVVDTMDYFAGVIKRKTNNTKLVGGFYCYMYEWQGNPEDGHQALRKYNQSKNLDFVWQTASYSSRGYITGGDLFRGPLLSNILHGKPWLNSNDTATFMVTGGDHTNDLYGWTNTIEKNRRMFLRSAGFNICTGGQLQEWFSLTDGWYNNQDMINTAVAPINALYGRSKNYDRSSNSQILVVSDEVSCSYTPWSSGSNALLQSSIYTPQIYLTQMGAPTDHILLDDISILPDPNQYKLVIFLNCWNMTTAQRTLVKNLESNNRTLLFCYGQGYFNGSSSTAANIQDVTGMTMYVNSSDTKASSKVYVKNGTHAISSEIYSKGITSFGPGTSICKTIYVNDNTATILGGNSSGGTNKYMAIKEFTTPVAWKSIYCTTAEMTAPVLRAVARHAGVHIYNENNDTFYANKCFVNIHPNHAEATQQSRTITFPVAVDVYDAITDTLLQPNTTSYTRSYYGGETMMYRYVPVP